MEFKFSRELRRQMKLQRLNPYDLAEKSGVTAAYIYRVMADKQNPTLGIATKLASALGMKFELTAK